MSLNLLAEPLKLPCGAVLPNRLCKSAMTEGVADEHLRPTPRHETLYRQWSEGGAGLLITGNVMIDRRVLERPGNVAIDPAPADPELMRRLKAWAKAGTVAGNHLWMQISHAGRQSPWYVTREPLAPSPVQLELLANYARPRALREDEILDFIQRYARVAATAREAGFTGVQIHAAHGYLLSSFLSGVTNLRTDAWGGSLENRARMLMETIKATRAAVGPDFPIGIKLNSADFQRGGFTEEESLDTIRALEAAGIDLIEISGGTYEAPAMTGVVKVKDSTQKREAYFLEFAEKARAAVSVPLLLTGGFRTLGGMAEAIESGAVDLVGIARAMAIETDLPARLLRGEEPRHTVRPIKTGIGLIDRMALMEVTWYSRQLRRISEGRKPKPNESGLSSFAVGIVENGWHTFKTRRLRA